VKQERGVATIEMVVIGFAIVAFVIPVVIATASLAEAHSRVLTAASDGAAWFARHGTEAPTSDAEVQVGYEVEAGSVRATATITVDVVPLMGGVLPVVISESVVVPISPYRSDGA
jgi:hypothetical protein